MATVLLRSVGERLVTQVTTAHHALVVDEPRPKGDDLGPSPYEMLLAALGSCTSMTMRMYAERRGWRLTEVQIELTHQRDHVRDCEECDTEDRQLDRITRRIHLEGELSNDQRARLLEIARRCPVHRTLMSTIEIVDELT